MTLHVRQNGYHTTVQDRGRKGQYSVGLPPSGAQDQFAYRVGNKLLRNDDNAAALEITLQGGEYEFGVDTTIAITGAGINPKLNNSPVNMWEAIAVEAGDVLSFGGIEAGCRAYVCVKDGIDVPLVLGSRSTYTNGDLGGYKGRTLMAGDELSIAGYTGRDLHGRTIPDREMPAYESPWTLRFITGMEDYRFAEKSKERFFSTEWKTNSTSDRVGYRFDVDEPLTFVEQDEDTGTGGDPSQVIMSPYPVGGLHAPSGSELILLANDAVTFGGFANLGAVITADVNLLGQIKPNDGVNFEQVTYTEAVNELREWERSITEIEIV